MFKIIRQFKVLNYNQISVFSALFFCLVLSSLNVLAQEDTEQDSTKVQLNYNKPGEEFEKDTLYKQTQALDIGSDRGLFILSADQKMQMRILGSVRAAFNYADQNMDSKNSFDPYEIPTNIQTASPNFFASLSQSRIGFEVTRRTEKHGDIFIRIETDFASQTNNLRLRHAYGQFKHLLVGQTWSLFSNVNYQPATVSFNGVVGSGSLRTPQIRFYGAISKKIDWGAAIEYSIPDFIIPDSIQASLLQVIPDITASLTFHSDLFSCNIAGVVATISGRDTTDKISYGFGVGGMFSGQFVIAEKNKIFFSVTSGKSISHFIGIFGGKREDAAYNPNTRSFETLPSTSGFIGYSRNFTSKLTANVSAGIAVISNKDYQADDSFSYGYNALLNIFWEPVEGARVGLEYANGQRFDIVGSRGVANKVSVLLYYDF